MLKGGLIKGKSYLVKGGPGSGKTTLASQFVYQGVLSGEKTLYITLEESAEEITEEMSVFGLDLSPVTFVDASPGGNMTIFSEMFFSDYALDLSNLKSIIEKVSKENKPSRIVIDPITMLEVGSRSEIDYRRDLLALMKLLRESGATTVITSERTSQAIEDFLVSGVIELLTSTDSGRIIRGIMIRKFRGSDFDEVIRPYRFTDRGIEVLHETALFK
jgi:KaiC/GvpD/RAD55 family RecA-like ATPase